MSTKAQVAQVDAAFKKMKTDIEEAARLDGEDMQNNHSFWDEVGNILKDPRKLVGHTLMMPAIGPLGTVVMIGVSAKSAKDSATQFHQDMQAEVNKVYKECTELWSPEVPVPGVGVRLTGGASNDLAAMSKSWKAEQDETLTKIHDALVKLEKPGEWKGEDADAYHHAIPSQRAATNDLKTLVAKTATLYGQGGKGLELALTGVQTTTGTVAGTVAKQRDPETEVDRDNWCARLKTIKASLQGLKDDLITTQKDIDDFLARVAQNQRDLQTNMLHSPSITDGKGKWPVAKGDKRKLGQGQV